MVDIVVMMNGINGMKWYIPSMVISPICSMFGICTILPTKLVDFVRANVGVHIPAPWSIWVG